MDSRIVTARIEADGWFKVTQKGSHAQFKHKSKPGRVSVMAEYIAYIHKDAGSDFGMSFPDFPGAVTAAPTLEELRRQAEEMLALHIEGMIANGKPVPEPATLDQVTQLPDYRDAVAVLTVHAPERPSATVRVNITLAEPVLKRIDRHAAKHGLTRSAFLARAAMKNIDAES